MGVTSRGENTATIIPNLNFLVIHRERDRTIQQAGGPPFVPQRTDGPRFTGGGFNLQQPSKVSA